MWAAPDMLAVRFPELEQEVEWGEWQGVGGGLILYHGALDILLGKPGGTQNKVGRSLTAPFHFPGPYAFFRSKKSPNSAPASLKSLPLLHPSIAPRQGQTWTDRPAAHGALGPQGCTVEHL